MISLKNAPSSGICYALYSDKAMVFEKYVNRPDELDEHNLLELHMFNSEKEFRVMKSEVADDGFIIKTISDAEVEYDDIFEESVYSESGLKVKVINYITYSNNDLLNICNYRLKEV